MSALSTIDVVPPTTDWENDAHANVPAKTNRVKLWTVSKCKNRLTTTASTTACNNGNTTAQRIPNDARRYRTKNSLRASNASRSREPQIPRSRSGRGGEGPDNEKPCAGPDRA